MSGSQASGNTLFQVGRVGLTVFVIIANLDQMATIDKIQAHGVGQIRIGIFALDHCDPHATCRDQNRHWTARIGFSFINDVVFLMDVMPTTARIPAHVRDQMKTTVANNLGAYRTTWWNFQVSNPVNLARGACCLNNQIVMGQTVVSATFDPATCETEMILSDGSVYKWPEP